MPCGICRSCNLNQVPACGKEHDARDAVRLYKKTMREEMLEFGDPGTVERKLTRHEIKVAERAAASRLAMPLMFLVLMLMKRDVVSGRPITAVSVGLVPRFLNPTKRVKIVTLP